MAAPTMPPAAEVRQSGVRRRRRIPDALQRTAASDEDDLAEEGPSLGGLIRGHVGGVPLPLLRHGAAKRGGGGQAHSKEALAQGSTDVSATSDELPVVSCIQCACHDVASTLSPGPAASRGALACKR